MVQLLIGEVKVGSDLFGLDADDAGVTVSDVLRTAQGPRGVAWIVTVEGSGALLDLRAFSVTGHWVVALETGQGLLVVAEVLGVVAVLESSILMEACSDGKAAAVEEIPETETELGVTVVVELVVIEMGFFICSYVILSFFLASI